MLIVAAPALTRYYFAATQGDAEGETDGLGAHPGFRHGGGGPGGYWREPYIWPPRNHILKAQLKGRLKLSDAERATLAEIGHRLGRKVLADVATVACPDTILAWYHKLVARKFDGSKACRRPGRPRIKREVAKFGATRTPISAQGGQQSGDCGQRVMAA